MFPAVSEGLCVAVANRLAVCKGKHSWGIPPVLIYLGVCSEDAP